jgi:hypothetical protein
VGPRASRGAGFEFGSSRAHVCLDGGWSPTEPQNNICSKGSHLGHDCAYQGVINYHRVFPVCPY